HGIILPVSRKILTLRFLAERGKGWQKRNQKSSHQASERCATCEGQLEKALRHHSLDFHELALHAQRFHWDVELMRCMPIPDIMSADQWTSTRPTSIYWPPRVWWQCTAITFLPGFIAARPALLGGRLK